MSVNKAVILLEASQFSYNVGDIVPKGGILGLLRNEPVVAPFDSVIQSISFNSEEHTLTVVLVETEDVR